MLRTVIGDEVHASGRQVAAQQGLRLLGPFGACYLTQQADTLCDRDLVLA